MKQRLPFLVGIIFLTMVLVVAELLTRPRLAIPVMSSPTRARTLLASEGDVSFEKFPTHFVLSVSPTSIPLKATYTLAASQTPSKLATDTLLPLTTSTQLSNPTQALLPSSTPVFFASVTATPFGGSATPPVPVAYSRDGKTQPCYKGPSLKYVQTDVFNVARIAGFDSTGTWWYLLVFKEQGSMAISCWAADQQVLTAGNMTELSIVEPELPQITQAKISAPGTLDDNGDYTASIFCDDGLTDATLHFSGQIFGNGPLKDIGYRWVTDAPVSFKVAHTAIAAWDAPAQVTLDLPVPSQAAVYTLSLRTTFPMEAVGVLTIHVTCRQF